MRLLKYALLTLIAFGFASQSLANTNVDIKNSSFKWSASKKIGDGHHGTIKLKSAKAKIEKGKIVSGEFVMDMTSFTVDDLDGEWEQKFLNHVKSGDFFLVGEYPEATLVITGQKDKDTAVGTLTIKEKPHPIEIDFNKKGNTYTGTMVFDRTKYDITYNSSKFFEKLAADKIINDEVKVEFEVKTTK
ncbi:MAG: YceI family protein [Bdellovibrionales bacterium]